MASILADLQQTPVRPSQERIATYGKRQDGTPKGAGYFGEIKHPGNSKTFSTELSIGVNLEGKDLQIPLLVPTLTRSEIQAVIAGKDTEAIVQKAVDHAKDRIQKGKSPYAEPNEYVPLPKE